MEIKYCIDDKKSKNGKWRLCAIYTDKDIAFSAARLLNGRVREYHKKKILADFSIKEKR